MDLELQLPDDPRLTYLSEAINSADFDKFKEILSALLSDFSISELLNLAGYMNLVCQKNLPAFAFELLTQGVTFYIGFAQTAANWKATDVLAIFIELGSWDINENISPWAPPLLGAVVHDESIVRWFIDHGADPNKRCLVDITPLSKAVEKAPVSTIKLLLDNGGDVKKGCLLHHAVYRGDDCVETLELLLSYNADINYIRFDPEKDKDSFDMMPFADFGTPLHTAIDQGNSTAVRYLLQHGADVNKLDLKDRSPLVLAKRTNHSEILDMVEHHLASQS